jgi:large subunit ribosomal protein L4
VDGGGHAAEAKGMSQISVITMERKPAGQLELADAFTETAYHPFLVKDAVVFQRAKAQRGTHSVKTRSMVQGSTRKLYRQKGTGNARAGDKKAPQRRGGGIAHGPKVRSHAVGMNKKVRKHALRSALAEKIRTGGLIVLDRLAPATHKTKAMAEFLAGMEAPRALIVTHELGDNLLRATRNLPGVSVVHYGQLHVYTLLRHEKTLVTRDALLALQQRLTA